MQSKTDRPFLQPASYDTHEVSSFLSKIIEIKKKLKGNLVNLSLRKKILILIMYLNFF